MNELVKKLSTGQHAIAAERSQSPEELKEQIEREFVLLKFTETQGGTELGCQLDMEQTKFNDADFASATGTVHIVGNLTLDYVDVQLVADIDLATLTGTGQLVVAKTEAIH